MNMVGVIFSNIYDKSFGELTAHRTLASLPFGGRYRLIDFVLSNMANSNITTVGIVTKYNYQSLMDHLGSCSEWDLNRKDGGVFILPPFGTGQTSVYQGKLEALNGALTYLKRAKGEYVVMSDTNVICNIDYENVLEAHIKSKAKVTVIATRQDPEHEGELADVVMEEEDSKVVDMYINHEFTKKQLVGMGMYVLEKNLLIKVVEEAVSHGYYYFEKDFLQRSLLSGKIDVNIYEYKHSVLRNVDKASYFKNNLKLLNETVRNDIFTPHSPIYTKVRDEAPNFYGDEAIVNNTLLADGCLIKGTVENSVIFRDVTIEEGAKVDNCIIMQGTTVKSGANLQYAIIDKDVVIERDRKLIGAEVSPINIKKGEVI